MTLYLYDWIALTFLVKCLESTCTLSWHYGDNAELKQSGIYSVADSIHFRPNEIHAYLF